jgi:glycosyltransferase involved in cell wall biosynthesis
VNQGDLDADESRTREEMVSVVLPTHNRPERLARAIGSALGQTYGNLEVIVVDDASRTDNRPIVDGFDDPRLRYIRLDQNQGAPGARNLGIMEATGKYVAFLDDDDEWLPDKLELQVADLKRKEGRFKVSYCIREFYDDDEKVVVGHSKTGWDGNHLQAFITGFIVPSTSCVVADKGCLDEVGGFRRDLPRLQDRELWLRLSEQYDFAFVDRVLVRMHLHGGGRISDDLPALLKSFAIMYEAHRRLLWKNPRSLGLFFLNWGYESQKAGDRSSARKLFMKSIVAFPFRKAPYVALGSLTLNRSIPSAETSSSPEE